MFRPQADWYLGEDGDVLDEDAEESDHGEEGGEEDRVRRKRPMSEDSDHADDEVEDVPDAFSVFTALVFVVLTERAVPSLLKITYGNLTNAYFALHDDSRTIETADKAIMLVGDNAQQSDAKYYYRRAVARARQQASFSGMKDYSAALRDITEAHKLNPTDRSIAIALVDIKSKVKSNKKTQARLIPLSLELP